MRWAISSTSFSLWLMKITDMPSRSVPRISKSSPASCGVSTAVGSSRMRTRSAIERLEDLDPLLLADADVLDARLRVDREAEAVRQLLTRSSAAPWSRKTAFVVGSLARMTFSATVITGMSMKCWCTMPMPWEIASFGE